jgi:hypothetical protein
MHEQETGLVGGEAGQQPGRLGAGQAGELSHVVGGLVGQVEGAGEQRPADRCGGNVDAAGALHGALGVARVGGGEVEFMGLRSDPAACASQGGAFAGFGASGVDAWG